MQFLAETIDYSYLSDDNSFNLFWIRLQRTVFACGGIHSDIVAIASLIKLWKVEIYYFLRLRAVENEGLIKIDKRVKLGRSRDCQ